MKTARRQELRTNELSQQIDHVGEYVRTNATVLTAVVLGGALVVGGIYWYTRHRQNQLMEAWHKLSQRAMLTDGGTPVDSYRSIAESGIDPQLTVQAWLKTGETAIMENVKVGQGSGKSSTQDWLKTAEDAYFRVLSSATTDGTALGAAMLGLGVIAENRGDIAKAKEWYRKVADDTRVKNTPLPFEANHRLAKIDVWSTPVEFPPPPPPPPPLPLPTATSAPVAAATSQPALMMSPVSLQPAPGAPAQPIAGLSTTEEGVRKPSPASAPAGG